MTGRVRAVQGDAVLVEHSGPGFIYSRSWALPPLEQSRMAMIPKKSHLALWQQSEIGLLNPRRPSPVFVHQYQAAVRRMGAFLERHRQDNSIRLVEPGRGESGKGVDVGPDGGGHPGRIGWAVRRREDESGVGGCWSNRRGRGLFASTVGPGSPQRGGPAEM